MAELAVAYISLVPSLKGATRQITSQLSGVDTSSAGSSIGEALSGNIGKSLNLEVIGAKFKDIGGSLKSVGGKLTKGITVPALGAATAIGGIAAAAGWKRLTGIENATQSIKGLGYTAEEAGDIIKGPVLDSVRGTAFGIAEAGSAAAGALAAGIEPGESLTRHLKLVGDAAAQSNTDFGAMARMLTDVEAAGYVSGSALNQMMENGLYATPILAEHLGITQEEVKKLASEGQISADVFRDAMENKIGGSAAEMGDTMQGAIANTMAAFGRFGERILEDVYPKVRGAFDGLIEALDGDALSNVADFLSNTLVKAFDFVSTAISNVVNWWNNLSPGMQKTIGIAAGVAVAIGPVVSILGGIVSGVGTLITVGSAVFKVIQVGTGIFKALNLVMAANPIGLVITAIAALVAGLVYFFSQTELGQKIWSGFVTFLQEAWANITAFLSETWANITGWFTAFGNGISNVWNNTWNAVTNAVQSAIQFVQKVIQVGILAAQIMWQTVWNAVRNFFTNVWNAIVSAATGFMNSVKNTFTSVTNFIGSIPSKIMGFFRGIGTWLLDSGKALIQGFINGIKSAFEGAKKIVSDGLGAIRNLFPFSPAKEGPFSGRGWVAYSGMSLGQTFTESIADSLHDGRKDIHDELGGIRREFDGMDAGFNAGFRLSSASPDAGLYGSSTPGYVVIKDVNDELVGRMRVEADGRIGSSLSPLSAGESLSRRGVRF